jgi:hypothetical protein
LLLSLRSFFALRSVIFLLPTINVGLSIIFGYIRDRFIRLLHHSCQSVQTENQINSLSTDLFCILNAYMKMRTLHVIAAEEQYSSRSCLQYLPFIFCGGAGTHKRTIFSLKMGSASLHSFALIFPLRKDSPNFVNEKRQY